MVTQPLENVSRASGPAAPHREVLGRIRDGDPHGAYRVARDIAGADPEDLGAVMLLLVAAGGCGDRAIEESLLVMAGHAEALLGMPEVLEMFESSWLAPVVSSRTFREVFGPALRCAQRRLLDADFDRAATERQVSEAVGQAAVWNALSRAPAFRPCGTAASSGPERSPWTWTPGSAV
jgi:hypothetical protein